MISSNIIRNKSCELSSSTYTVAACDLVLSLPCAYFTKKPSGKLQWESIDIKGWWRETLLNKGDPCLLEGFHERVQLELRKRKFYPGAEGRKRAPFSIRLPAFCLCAAESGLFSVPTRNHIFGCVEALGRCSGNTLRATGRALDPVVS
ncbi:hypothetical protein TWF569_011740 [Orbilia oligospora]|nr:hypothetical protein TWF103_001766 [Orbilia oligospora]KAF3120410.1 hypothetical protein TWF594_003906 [Orbilia oligospora]KAF3127596.1 hypothetical protein TWF569_011740 [Orbilia oligospora]